MDHARSGCAVKAVAQGLAVAAIAAAATFAAGRVSSDELASAVKVHAQQPHGNADAADVRHDVKLAKLEALPEDIRAIRARIDLILLRDSERSPERKRLRRGAAKIRAAAAERGESDPLAGLEDL